MNKKILQLSLIAFIIAGCSAHKSPIKPPQITIPKNIQTGECERKITELKGNSARELVLYASSLIDKVKYCRLEKASIIKQIQKYNEEIGK